VRQVVVYELLSADGVAEEPSDWMFDVDEETLAFLRRTIERQDAVLLGRGTYDYWCDHWPTSDMEPFASFINGTPKHVFSSSEPAEQWVNSTFVNGPVVDHVTALKQQPGGDIGVHASITLARSLLRARLVDELRLVVAPTLAGSGRRLFDDIGDMRRLELLESERTPAGNLLLVYRLVPES